MAQDDKVAAAAEEEKGKVIYSSKLGSRKVIRISGDRVVKTGPNLRAHEAQTLRFIAANTTIPVPRVHNVRFAEDGRVSAIVMDYVPGKTLEKAWEDMTPDQKLSVAQELHGYVCQLRRLKGNYIGAVDHGKAIIGKHAPLEGGPFSTERLFNEFILGDIVRTAPDLLRHYAPYALRIIMRLFSPMAIWFPGIYWSMKNAVSRLSSIGNILVGIQSLGIYQGAAVLETNAGLGRLSITHPSTSI